jgi:hypothetical protein
LARGLPDWKCGVNAPTHPYKKKFRVSVGYLAGIWRVLNGRAGTFPGIIRHCKIKKRGFSGDFPRLLLGKYDKQIPGIFFCRATPYKRYQIGNVALAKEGHVINFFVGGSNRDLVHSATGYVLAVIVGHTTPGRRE